MNQYDKKQIKDFMIENGYNHKSGIFSSEFGNWERIIWFQSGVSSLSGKFTINFELINSEILGFTRPNLKPGKGNSVISIRIGELLGNSDRWYSSITPTYVQETTNEVIRDLKIALIKFQEIDNEEKIAKTLWEHRNYTMSCFVMSLYLETNRIESIINDLNIRNEFKSEIINFSKMVSSQKEAMKTSANLQDESAVNNE